MPLIDIRYQRHRISHRTLVRIGDVLPRVAAAFLTCKGGSELTPEDIMLEFEPMSTLNRNCKDIHLRVWAHDYPARRGKNLSELKKIRRHIAAELVRHLPRDTSWYVWVLLATTSYGSDTLDD